MLGVDAAPNHAPDGEKRNTSNDPSTAMRAYWVIVTVFVVTLALVPPAGEFPSIDDWDYAASAVVLAETGHLRLTDWPAMTLVCHVAWGALFIKLFGFSYVVLRMSVLLLALSGALAIVRFYRRHGQSPANASFVALWWLFCPLVWCFSYTFMTDVPAVSIMAVWVALLPQSVRAATLLRYVLLGVLGAAGYLVRQTAAVPVVVLATLLLIDCLCGRMRPGRMLALSIPFGAAVAGHWVWLNYQNGVPYNTQLAILDWSIVADPHGLLIRVGNLVLRGGFYASPFAVALMMRAPIGRSFVRRAVAITVATLFVMTAAFSPDVSPYSGVVFDLGLDTDASIPGRNVLRGPSITIGGEQWSLFRTLAILLAGVSVSIVVEAVLGAMPQVRVWFRCREWRRSTITSTSTVLIGSLLSSLALLVLVHQFFDRYLMSVLLLGALAWIVYRKPDEPCRSVSCLAWLLLIAMVGFSVAGVEDYMARTRAVWQAIDALHRRGVPVAEINGGFAYAGAYRFTPRYFGSDATGPYLASLPPEVRQRHLGHFGPHAYMVASRTYTIAFARLPGYAVDSEFPYRTALRSGVVFVLRRER